MTKKLKILLLDTLHGSELLINTALVTAGLSCEILTVYAKGQFVVALKDFLPDIILSEYTLPDLHSAEALVILRSSGLEIPFIIISDTLTDEQATNELVTTGADDYIEKDRPGRLAGAVLRSLEKYRYQKECQSLLEKLTNSEKRFHALVENSMDAVVILTWEGKPSYVSPAVKNVLGYTPEQIMAMDLDTLVHAEDVAAIVKVMDQVRASPCIAFTIPATRMKHKDGGWRWIESVLTNLIHEPAIKGIVNNYRDVTNKWLREEKILQLNRMYAFMSQINQALVHAGDAQTVYKKACRIACETGKFKAAWIGMLDVKRRKIDLVESCGIPDQDLRHFKNITYLDDGPLQRMIESGTSYVSNNINQDPALLPLQHLAAHAGYKSGMILPIRQSGHIIGSFNLYGSETEVFTGDEMALLLEAASDISFALDVFEKERLRILANQQLKRKELRLSQAQAIAHLGSWELHLATGIAIWSDEACRIHGLSEKDNTVSTQEWISFVHPDDVGYVKKINNDMLTSLRDTDYYHRIIRKDGQTRYLHMRTQLEVDQQGTPVSIYGVMHDVTETEKSQHALRTSEAHLRAVFQNTSEGFILTNSQVMVQYFNNKAKDFIQFNTGLEIQTGNSLFDVIGEARKENYKAAIAKVLSGEIWRYEYAYDKSNGKKHWFDVTVIPVYKNGQIIGLSLTITEITEQKIAQQQLQKSESSLNAIMNNTDAFIYSLDTNFKFITYNNVLKSMMKSVYKEDLVPGYDFYNMIRQFDPDSLQRWKQYYFRALGGEVVKFEKEILMQGIHSYFNISIHPIYENNLVTGLSCFVNDITKEKQLDERRRFKANLLNMIGQAVIATDLNGVINYWNRAAEQIYGWTEQEALGKNIVDLTPTQATQEQAAKIMETLRLGKSWSGEFVTQRKNGRYFPAFVTNTPIYGQHYELTGIIGISSDITEIKALQGLLDEATGMARVGGYNSDLETNELFWSPMTRQIHEVADDFIPHIEKAMSFYKQGKSLESLTLAYQEAVVNGTAFDLELEIVTARGNERWVRVIGETELKDGKCSRVYGSFQDIDTMKRTELQVLKAYEEKNVILESIGDAFFTLDKKWVFTYWNKEAEMLLNRPKNEILGKIIWDVFPEIIDTSFQQYYHRAVEQNAIQHFESYYQLDNKWFDVTAYPSGSGLSVYFRDITERKFSESRMNELNKNLQDYANELIASNKGLEQFSYIVSHNLRAPVANILGLAGLLSEDNYPAEVKEEFLSGIILNVKRLDDVITDLNTILQVKRGISENKEVVDLRQLVNNIKLSIQTVIVKEQVRIQTDFGAIQELTTLKSYLHSIFYNLILNSIKYRQPEIPVVIQIKSSLNHGTVKISISDNGMGIDLIRKGGELFGLYKRFHQHVEGKGMGLFMVKTQVEMLGGKIYVSSEINKGTEFVIEFNSDHY